MFEKFTEKAKRILFLARYEASQQGAKAIQTEHILLGLLKEGEETTRELFTRANVSMDLLQSELEQRGPSREKLSTSVEIPFGDETKQVLQFAEEEAERLMHPHIGTEHILLGLLRLEDCAAGRMLIERGMRLFAVREDAVDYRKDPVRAARDVRAGRAAVALYVNALTPEDVFRVTAAGEVLPQKSTLFLPKIPTGLLFRVLGDEG